ncbi:MAG: gamma-glutamylcyclotransferase [Paracoccaceae bacterium]
MGRSQVGLTAGATLFFYGTLRDIDLLQVVTGREVAPQPARLPGYEVFWAAGQDFPMIAPDPDGQAEGIILRDLSPQEVARFDYYELPYGYVLTEVSVETAEGPLAAQVYMPAPDILRKGAPWSLEDWQARFGPLMREAAQEIMESQNILSAAEVAARSAVIETRAQARLNAREYAPPVRLRRGFTRADVTEHARRRKYSKFFVLDEVDLSYRQFSQEDGPEIERAVFISADAVTVLPYDPVRDTVLLIEQFRVAPYMRGDPVPWSLEAIAGRIDAGERPEEAARREAREEAGLTLSALHHISNYYPSPGAKTEYLFSYLGITDLPPEMAGIGGLETEAEDIRSMVISFDALMAAIRSGEVENAPLILSALWLERERGRLRQDPRAGLRENG